MSQLSLIPRRSRHQEIIRVQIRDRRMRQCENIAMRVRNNRVSHAILYGVIEKIGKTAEQAAAERDAFAVGLRVGREIR